MIILHFRKMLLTVVQVGRRESHWDCCSRPGEVVVGTCVTAVGVGERGEDLPGGLRTRNPWDLGTRVPEGHSIEGR